jgi:hypothetical protein
MAMNREQSERNLRIYIETALPEFAASCKADADVVLIHQDAFAADYQEEEYSLLGKVVKYAGLFGKNVLINGKNSETFNTSGEKIM